jgi:hypothetical protein
MVGGVDQTSHVQDRTLGLKLHTADFTLIDPATMPVLHDSVGVDTPEWHGRVSTVESYPFKAASGTEHHYVKVTATNKVVAASDTAPFGLSDTPDYSTTYPFKDLVVIRTLADQTDLSTAELRVQGTIYQPGLVPGMTVGITCSVESLSAEPVIVTEMTVSWLDSTNAVYHMEFSDSGVPPVTLGQVISDSACDCTIPYEPCTPDYSVYSLGGVKELYLVFPSHTSGQGVASTDSMLLYVGATYHVEYLCYHPPTSSRLFAYLMDAVSAIGSAGTVPGESGTPPACFMGGAYDDGNAVPYGDCLWLVDENGALGTPGLRTVKSLMNDVFYTGSDSYAASLATHITWVSGPDPRFETLTCEDPRPGQPIAPEEFVGDGSTDTFSLTWPYMPGSIEVLVDGVDWSDEVTETDPTTGSFSLTYAPPAGAVLIVRYRFTG